MIHKHGADVIQRKNCSRTENVGLSKSHSEADLPSKQAPKPKLKRSESTVQLKALPSYMVDNEFLLDYHRPELNSIMECIKSVFMMHTETWNIWTHFIGCLGVVCLAVHYFIHESESWHQSLSFAVFFAGAAFCMGCSTIYHVLFCHSERYCRFWAKMDYCGIVILIIASLPPWVHFAFYCTTYLKPLYIGVPVVFGIGALAVVLSDKYSGGDYRVLRAVVFISLGMTGLAPAIHYIATHDFFHWNFYFWLILACLFYFTGGVIYATRIPERFLPGKFDIWLQSHQILHLCVIGGVLTCYQGASKLAQYRISSLEECPGPGL